MKNLPFPNWQAVKDASRSAFFRGHTSDTVFDRTVSGALTPNSESLFTQSNARVLIGQASNGSLRMIALPTGPVYPVPSGTQELGYAVGMYHHFDVAMYAGDLSYRIELDDGGAPIDLSADDRDNETAYAGDFLPFTQTIAGPLEVAVLSLAPVAADAQAAPLAPAPLPGPAGALYVLLLKNTGDTPVTGKLVLQASDLLVGHYEDANPALRDFRRPGVHLRQQTLILTRPEGAVGIHLHLGTWTKLTSPFESERAFSLDPGEEIAIETHVAEGNRRDG